MNIALSAVLFFEVTIFTGKLVDAMLDSEGLRTGVLFGQCLAIAIAAASVLVASAFMVCGCHTVVCRHW